MNRTVRNIICDFVYPGVERSFTFPDHWINPNSMITYALILEDFEDKSNDDVLMDTINVYIKPYEGYIVCYLKSATGSLFGKYHVSYMLHGV